MKRKPLVLDDAAQFQQLQSVDRLDARNKTEVSDFLQLHRNFALLCQTLSEQGVPLPDELLEEIEQIEQLNKSKGELC